MKRKIPAEIKKNILLINKSKLFSILLNFFGLYCLKEEFIHIGQKCWYSFVVAR